MSGPFYVYLLFRLDGTPCYVGKGKGDRWRRHEGRATHANLNLQRIIDAAKASGRELPKIKIAEDLDESTAFEYERAFIAAIGRKAHGGPLVNLTDGGDGPAGYQPSPELIARQSVVRKGRTLSPEWRAAISAGLKGKPKAAEHVANVAKAQRGGKKVSGWWSTEEGRAKQRTNNPGNTGRSHSEEAKAKIRAARLRQTNISTIGYFPKGKRPATQKENVS